jgi:D-sedoheptulose 7-phosphate isomerase
MVADYLDSFFKIIRNTAISDKKNQIMKIDTAIDNIVSECIRIKTEKKNIYLIGNGGSNGIASHTSVDFINSCKIKAFPLTDASNLTCFANDFGYESVFSKPLQILIEKDDILIAISSSGNSKNILNAVEIAKAKETVIITLSGFNENNKLRSMGNYNIWVNSQEYGKVEIAHAFWLHLITDLLKKRI